MRPRDFITFLAGLMAAWPLSAAAQVPPKLVIGFLHGQSSDPSRLDVTKFREGLNEEGYVEGRNVVIEQRWGNNNPIALPELAADLVQRRVAVIVTDGGLAAARAAQAASSTIPIVFVTGLDPAENGFVASLNRPGGNATGVVNYDRELIRKRLELLRELVDGPPHELPQRPATKIAYLQNFDDRGLDPGARKQNEDEKLTANRLFPLVLDARSEKAIDESFEVAVKHGIGALLVGADPFFGRQRAQIVALAGQHRLPAGYQPREFAEAGGLMSYGPIRLDLLRRAGVYAGRILKGANPAEMPVLTPTKFEMVINLKTAKALGLTVRGTLLVSADEIIK